MTHKELTQRIIGFAYRGYRRMAYGFLKSVYEKSLVLELRQGGLRPACQQSIWLSQDGEVAGQVMAGAVVEDRVIVERKSARRGLNCLVPTSRFAGESLC